MLSIVQVEAHLVIALIDEQYLLTHIKLIRNVKASIELSDLEAGEHARHEVQVLLVDKRVARVVQSIQLSSLLLLESNLVTF